MISNNIFSVIKLMLVILIIADRIDYELTLFLSFFFTYGLKCQTKSKCDDAVKHELPCFTVLHVDMKVCCLLLSIYFSL
jgi:hypothetical protein